MIVSVEEFRAFCGTFLTKVGARDCDDHDNFLAKLLSATEEAVREDHACWQGSTHKIPEEVLKGCVLMGAKLLLKQEAMNIAARVALEDRAMFGMEVKDGDGNRIDPSTIDEIKLAQSE